MHDVDIVVTESGLADLREPAPRECAVVSAKSELFANSWLITSGAPWPRVAMLADVLSWHTRRKRTGTMPPQEKCGRPAPEPSHARVPVVPEPHAA